MRDLVAMILKGLDGGGACRGLKADVYLAFSGVKRLHIEGFLVTEPGARDGVIAFVPVSDPEGPPATPSPTMAAAMAMYPYALAVARSPRHPSEHAIHFCDKRALPRWLFGLKCVPLTRPWDGRWVEATPFCAEVFGALAASPLARAWLERQAS